ncbi:hypothetical protein JTE87_03455 [Bacillus amyloliquefaciens]|nr:hypothetical protein [Bacillus amyloliquefaciens]
MLRALKLSLAMLIIILAAAAFTYAEHTSVIQPVMLVFLGAVMFIQGWRKNGKKTTAPGNSISIPPFLYGRSP